MDAREVDENARQKWRDIDFWGRKHLERDHDDSAPSFPFCYCFYFFDLFINCMSCLLACMPRWNRVVVNEYEMGFKNRGTCPSWPHVSGWGSSMESARDREINAWIGHKWRDGRRTFNLCAISFNRHLIGPNTTSLELPFLCSSDWLRVSFIYLFQHQACHYLCALLAKIDA